jgi:HK97 family phage major capsid protein
MERLSSVTERYQVVTDSRAFFQHAICRAVAGGSTEATIGLLEQRLDRAQLAVLHQRAAVAPMTTATDAGMGAPTPWAAAFLALVGATTALDRLGARPAPFNVLTPTQTGTASFSWVGEAAPAPVSALATASLAALIPAKISGIRVWSRELLIASDPKIQAIIEADSRRCIAVATDRLAFALDLDKVDNVSPASLCFGATEVAASGSTGESVEIDAEHLLTSLSNGDPELPRFVVNKRVALYLATLRTTAGLRAFPAVSITGGTILGAEVLLSSGAPDALIAVDGAGLLKADGGIEIALATRAALQMFDAPGAGPQARTSLFQTGMTALRLTRHLNFARRSDAVAFRRVPIGGSPA